MLTDLSITNIQTFQPVPGYYSQVMERPPLSIHWEKPNSNGASQYEVRSAMLALDELTKLPTDWDGHGAIPIAMATVNNVRVMLSSLLKAVTAPDVTPNSNGTISLEWESSIGFAHLEIGLTKFSLFIKPISGASTFVDGVTAALDAKNISEIGTLIANGLFPRNTYSTQLTRLQFAAAGNDFT